MSPETLALFLPPSLLPFFLTSITKTPEAATPGTFKEKKKGKETQRVPHSNPHMLISAKMEVKCFMIQNYATVPHKRHK